MWYYLKRDLHPKILRNMLRIMEELGAMPLQEMCRDIALEAVRPWAL